MRANLKLHPLPQKGEIIKKPISNIKIDEDDDSQKSFKFSDDSFEEQKKQWVADKKPEINFDNDNKEIEGLLEKNTIIDDGLAIPPIGKKGKKKKSKKKKKKSNKVDEEPSLELAVIT